MNNYPEKTFQLPELKGLSAKQIEVHLKLYAGYVKHTNLIFDQLAELEKETEKNVYLIAELRRRLGFEFDGMRLHEYYFEGFEQGAKAPNNSGELIKALSEQYGSYEKWLSDFKAAGMSRGIGWTILYYDPKQKRFLNTWVSDHELGHLAGLEIIIAMDMWEHAYMVDYVPAEKMTYIEAFFNNLNWEVIESRFKK